MGVNKEEERGGRWKGEKRISILEGSEFARDIRVARVYNEN